MRRNPRTERLHDVVLVLTLLFSAIGGGGFGAWQDSYGAGVFMTVVLFNAVAAFDGLHEAIREALSRREP